MLLICKKDYSLTNYPEIKFEKDKIYLFSVMQGKVCYYTEDEYYEVNLLILELHFTQYQF